MVGQTSGAQPESRQWATSSASGAFSRLLKESRLAVDTDFKTCPDCAGKALASTASFTVQHVKKSLAKGQLDIFCRMEYNGWIAVRTTLEQDAPNWFFRQDIFWNRIILYTGMCWLVRSVSSWYYIDRQNGNVSLPDIPPQLFHWMFAAQASYNNWSRVSCCKHYVNYSMFEVSQPCHFVASGMITRVLRVLHHVACPRKQNNTTN